MSAALTDIGAVERARRIVEAHDACAGAARDALAHAIRAGELLGQAKAALPHGQFGAFCESLPFGATTARGYMRVSAHWASLDGPNRQRVADLPLRSLLLEMAEPARPWTPEPGHWHMYAADDAAWHVVPALNRDGLFHVTKMWNESEDDSRWRGTLVPIEATDVDARLRFYSLGNPGSVAWMKYPRPGLPLAFGMPESQEKAMARFTDQELARIAEPERQAAERAAQTT